MSKTTSHQNEETYERLTPHEHILTLPDTYIGSIVADKQDMWVFDSEEKKIVFKNITYVPGLYKIYDEILVNARDHTVKDHTCKTIKVNINHETGEISVWNDGNGIPVAINKKENMYNPELIFGVVMTSSNYNKTGKTWGGKNGFGAKLANIYSKHFYVDTLDVVNKKRYTQHFYDNMFKKDKATITDIKKSDTPYTKITFIPDYERFGIKGLTDDMVALFKKRVYDIASYDYKRVKVYLNDEELSINSFGDYIKMFFPNVESKQMPYKEVNDCWKVGVVYTPSSGFSHVSHVNGLCTFSAIGGTHVSYVTEQITKGLLELIKGKYKNITVKPAYLKENMTVFVDCVTTDPAFNSQTKECLTNKVSSFLKKCEIDDNFIIAVSKTGIVEDAVNFATIKNSAELKKTDGKKVGKIYDIDNLVDAKWAGGRHSNECRLIITEGNSAAAFAIEGLEVIGKDRFGVFPIRGKMLNVRDAPAQQVLKNHEIEHIKKILGLKQGVVYTKENIKTLRYGGIFLLTDADTDGYHIKGLVINFIETFWPELAQIKGFFQTINTPIIKVYKKTDVKVKHPIIFYNLTEYYSWVKTIGSNVNKYNVDYYKGLGTSEDSESRDAFKDFEKKLLSFVWESEKVEDIKKDESKDEESESDEKEDSEDDSDDNSDKEDDKNNKDEQEISEKSSQSKDSTAKRDDYVTSKSHKALLLAFSKPLADERKRWLGNYDRNVILVPNDQMIPYSEFINKELIHFSNDDNLRSIPSICDGLKPSQRKILFTILEQNLDRRAKKMKVQDFGSLVSARTSYIHGPVSLFDAITKMGQNFVGSNNINVLYPLGNFGHRREGGADAANERYTHTFLGQLTRLIFRKEDDPIYNYLTEENKLVEPETYAPIIPMVLVNGAEGIGTGYSTSIPCYNPKDIVNNIVRLMNDMDPEPMKPWYAGFKGAITKKDDYTYISHGIYDIPENDEYTIKISELPIGTWTLDYEKMLKKCVTDKDNKTLDIDTFDNSSGNSTIDFTVTFSGHTLQRLIKSDTIEAKLKLCSSIATSNMHLYNANGKMTKYDVSEDILRDFYDFRLGMYEKRKKYYTRILKNELDIITYKIKFIKLVCDDKLVIARKSEDEIIGKLVEFKFPKLSHDINAINSDDDIIAKDDVENEESTATKKVFTSYDYVTKLPLFALTKEKIKELESQHDAKKAELEIYESTSAQDLWKKEMNEFIEAYDKWLEEELVSRNTDDDGPKKKTKTAKSSKSKAPRKSKKQLSD